MNSISEQNNTFELFKAEYIQGNGYFSKNDFANAYEHLKIALNALKELNNPDYEHYLADIKMRLAVIQDTWAKDAFNRREFTTAIDHYKELLLYNPNNHITLHNIGMCYFKNNEANPAIDFLKKAIEIKPDYVYSHKLLGKVYYNEKMYMKSRQSYESCLKLDDSDVGVVNLLGHICSVTGYIDKCVQYYGKSIQMDPLSSVSVNNFLISNMKNPANRQKDIYNISKETVDNYLKTANVSLNPDIKHKNMRDKNKKIHVGYLSADFYEHTVIRFFEPILEHHNKDRFKVTCYSNTQKPDHTTERCRSYADEFKDISKLDDSELAELIQNDEVDILVDLSGHSGFSRIFTLAYRPASVQITYLGYPNTTGLSEVDYILSDKMTVLEDDVITEKPLYIDFGYECYKINPKPFPEVGTLPAIQNKYVTFGYFNCMSKFNPPLVEVFSDILKSLPDSKLLIHRIALDEIRISELYKEFNQAGIDESQLIISNQKGNPFEMLNSADIALDPFPYNGTSTTIDSVIMGLPVICIYGDMPHTRSSARINTILGLTELIAKDRDEYVRIAVELAKDTQKLATIRKDLRDRFLNSKLTDHAGFVRSLEDAYIRAWQTWCDEN